ncbi:MAG: ABC transporter permease, partial [Bacteroidota bacterium]
MFRNYFKTAVRNLINNRAFSLINIIGLSAGMAVCLFIITMVQELKSFDQFHANKDRIYRVISDRTSNSSSSFATSPAPLYQHLVNDFPEVKQVTRILRDLNADVTFGQQTTPLNGLYVEPSFFELFDFPMLQGDPITALQAPFSVVLTTTALERLGMDAENIVGQNIEIAELGLFKVTGVLDQRNVKTHLQFEVLASYASIRPLQQAGKFRENLLSSWDDTNDHFLYFLLHPKSKTQAIVQALPTVSDRVYADMDNYRLDFRLQALTQITPNEFLENDLSVVLPRSIVYFLSFLALLVLLTACFNYTNLSVARALTRLREVGVRKVLGAQRSHIFFQFICESILIALFALLLAWTLLEVFIIPQFYQFSFTESLQLQLQSNAMTIFWFVLFSLFVGLMAGFLPAIYLSTFQPAQVLKSIQSLKVFARLGWRKTLMI